MGAIISLSFFLLLLFGLMNFARSTACMKSMTLYANFTKQYLTSQNYPETYPRPSSCSWTISAVEGNIIVFRFLHFEVESSIFCYKDLFSIQDGHTGWALELMSMCGSFSSKNKFKTDNDMAIIKFRAVTSGSDHPGFNISFWTENKVIPPWGAPHYTRGNYVLMVASGVAFVLFVTYLFIIVWSQWRKMRKSADDDESYNDDDESVCWVEELKGDKDQPLIE